ncbi:MAG: TrkH family potassium uptake protein [Pseudobacteriovorax sp.]|nr:TrkH family potassium uptake protein [Pseudobacteriovorax sp.]
MNFKAVAQQIAALLGIITFLFLGPLGLAIYDGDESSAIAYGATFLVFVGFTGIARFHGGKKRFDISRREALLVVTAIWIFVGFGGALPFYIEGSIKSFPGAVFESVSGLTTTGATVVADVESLSRATNLWRCLSHWIGGMGIVVLFVAIFPQTGVGGKQFFRNESAGPINSRVRPRIRDSALALWWIYCFLTVACALSLYFAGMSVFDAICHAFSTLGTGGFSTKANSIGHFNNPTIEWVVAGFMFVAGLNFALFFSLLRDAGKSLFWNSEFRVYLFANMFIAGIIAVSLSDDTSGFMEAVRLAIFQTLAVSTSAGFMTDDFNAYPSYAKFLLFVAMFVGGCAGSTAGGLKVIRMIILFKLTLREIRRSILPQEVSVVRHEGKPIVSGIIHGVTVYFVAYFFIFFLCSFLMTVAGYPMLDAMSSVVACLSSIGPGFNSFGPTQSFAHVPGWAKYVLCFCMIAGRLEIIVLFAPFTKTFWKR